MNLHRIDRLLAYDWSFINMLHEYITQVFTGRGDDDGR